jgi:murein L,D-transpeptidase YafK
MTGEIFAAVTRRHFLGASAVALLLPACARDVPQTEPLPFVADRVVVHKGERRLFLARAGKVFRVYRIALGRAPEGPKRREGDGRTPEGRYLIDGRNPRSRYHLALRISYPSPVDIARAASEGVDPGGDIMIHGLGPVSPRAAAEHPLRDWTEGCVAVTNREIEEIWAAVPDGTPIDILP